MATADTARLIAALELQDKFTGPLGGAERKLGGFEKRMGGISRSAQTMSRGVGTAFSTISRVAVGGAVAGIGLLAVNVKAGVDSLNELQSANTATNTVLKSTKGISGQTAAGIRDMSEEFENLNATMDDKVIQSGANLLLTFTNIRTKAFEPALEAALNMNEAMGGGEEGLQSTIIQVGKALNDPIKGVTALRRVGVQLSKQQEDQIKVLVEQNDLYGAQRIILDELTTQFGGRFAAAGRDEIGRQAALADRIEDVQKALAGPLIPAITRAREKLIDLLGSDRILDGADRLGRSLAGLFSDQNLDRGVAAVERGIDALSRGDFSGISGDLGNIASTVGGLPWDSIGDAARLLGTGSKALLDAFLGLPSWVQTAVLTGWGLNKLTGGALGSIVGELGKGLVKGVLGMNAGVVNINAASVNGGTGPVAAGGKGGGGLLGKLGAVTIVGTGLALLTEIATGVNKELNPTSFNFNELAGGRGASRVQVEGDLLALTKETGLSVEELQAAAIPLLQSGDSKWSDIVNELRTSQTLTRSIDTNMLTTARRAQDQADAVRQAKAAASFDQALLRTAVGNVAGNVNRLANTPHIVNTNVNLTTNVGVSVLGQMAYRTRTIANHASESTNTAGF